MAGVRSCCFLCWCFSIGYVLMSLAPTLTWLFVARLIAGISSSTFALSYAYITHITPPEIRAQRFGLVGAAFRWRICAVSSARQIPG